MPGEELLAEALLVLYHHINGEWKPVKGDQNSKSHSSLVKGAKGSHSIKVTFQSTNETLLVCPLTKSTTFTLQQGFETFYLLYDGKVYWGFWFADVTVGNIFVEKTRGAVAGVGSDAVKSTKSTPSVNSSKVKSNSEDAASSERTSSAPSKKITSTVSESPLKPAPAASPKINSTASEAVLSKSPYKSDDKPATPDKPGVTPNKSARQTTAFATPTASSSTSSTNSATSTSTSTPTTSSNGLGSTPGALKRPVTMAPSASPLVLSSGSLPSSPAPSDDSLLTSTPSSKSLKRPDAAVRPRSGTIGLASSDDQHSKPAKSEKAKRDKIIDEVLKTEEDYVDSLILIREKYLLPLKYAPRLGVSIFKPGDLEKIMYGLEPIYVLNSALLSDLKMRKHDETLYESCGLTLHRYAPSMKLYIDYVNKYDNTIKMIKDYEESSPVFKAFLVATSEDPESAGRAIRDFWIMPVQRIPRYALLMNELLKNTPETHADYSYIKQALSQFQDIASYINDRKKNYDSQEKVALIQQRMNPKAFPVMREGRTWVAEGTVYMRNGLFIPPKKPIVVKKGKPEPTPELLGLMEVEFFLLNDLILWAAKDPKHGYLNDLGRINVIDLESYEEVPHWTVPFYENTSMYKGFSLMTQDNRDTLPIFYCSDAQSCAHWMAVIKETFIAAANVRLAKLERQMKH